MALGYRGRILRIDLSEGTVGVEERDERFYRTYLGGKGFVGYYLLREVPSGADALGPENILVFTTGVMGGTSVPGFSRVVVGAKSPLTGGYGESEVGGSWGVELKRAGYDGLVIRGASRTPVYIAITGDGAEIRDARELWGATTSQVEKRIAERFRRRPAVMSIGPAGERLVRFACIMQGERDAAGRCGMGAVMGAKNLKAIAVLGSGKVAVKDEDGLKSIASWFAQDCKRNPPSVSLTEGGTTALVGPLQAAAILPTRNFAFGQFDGWKAIARLSKGWDAYEMMGRGCWGCPIRCKRTFRVTGGSAGDGGGEWVAGPEYETVAAFGSNLCVDDPVTILKANVYCNEMGMDTISAGMTVAFLMECCERGLIDDGDLNHLKVGFGNASCVLPVLELIAERKGIGDLLAEGSARAAQRIGKGSDAYALHVKGQELPMHDPRGKAGVGLGYALADHGADHMTAPHDTMFTEEGSYGLTTCSTLGLLDPLPARSLDHRKIRLYLYGQMWWDVLKCLGACFFCVAPRGLMPVSTVIDGVRSATGWDFSLWEAMKVADRAACMARAFNVREGFGPESDRLPSRLFEGSGDEGAGNTGICPEQLKQAIHLYYDMRGWDPGSGIPTSARLKELGIDWVSSALRED